VFKFHCLIPISIGNITVIITKQKGVCLCVLYF